MDEGENKIVSIPWWAPPAWTGRGGGNQLPLRVFAGLWLSQESPALECKAESFQKLHMRMVSEQDSEETFSELFGSNGQSAPASAGNGGPEK